MFPRSQPNRSTGPTAPAISRRGDDAPGLAERSGKDEPFGIEEDGRWGDGRCGDGGWGDTPNPFARVIAASEPSAKSRFVRAVKTLVVTLMLTVLLMAGVFFGRQFLLAHWITGFDDLDAAAKQSRLTQIAGFGFDAIEPLVDKLVAEDDAVSASAFTLLQQLQNDWITLSPADAQSAHHRLIGAIAATFCPPRKPAPSARQSGQTDRPNPLQRARASELLRQSVLEFSSAPAQSGELLAAANGLLATLDVRAPSQPMLVDSPVKLAAETRPHSVSKVVQFSSPVRQSGWTDWPPGRPPAARIVRSGTRQANFSAEQPASSTAARSHLQSLPPGVMAPLRPISPAPTNPAPPADAPHPDHAARPAGAAMSPVLATRHPAGRVIQVVAHRDEEVVATRRDAAWIEQLASPVAGQSELARMELVQRGLTPPQVQLARNWSTAAPAQRLALVDSLAHSGQLESALWLSVALGDPDREVRLRVASVLEKTDDTAVLAKLRKQLARESDPHVAYRIRRILDRF